MPDIQGPEVGAVRVGIADALQDGYFTLVVHVFDRGHGRVEPNLVVNGQDVFRSYINHFAVIVVMRVAVGDERIQGVIGPSHLKNYQNRIFLIGGHHFSLAIFFDVPEPIDC